MSDPLSQEGALHEAVEKAYLDIGLNWGTVGLQEVGGLTGVLQRLVREAQVSALESVAKEMCGFCSEPKMYPSAALTVIERGGKRVERWRHVIGEDSYLCDAPEVHAALSRLRQSASAPRKET